MDCDICIIGAGVIGGAIARELSRYDIQVCLLERNDDVASETTKANSGIVHGGYDAKNGTLKAKFSAAGNALYAALDKELHFGFRQCGSFVIGFNDEDKAHLQALYENGLKNGARGLKLVDGDFVRRKDSYISDEVTCALYCESAGVTSPYSFAIALAENAIDNGVKLFLNTAVTEIKKSGDIFQIATNGTENFTARIVINAAGLYVDKIAAMLGLNDFAIEPRKGQYLLFDKAEGERVKHVIFQTPSKVGKGVLISPTYEGNLLIGPNAEVAESKEDRETSVETIEYIIEMARKSVLDFDVRKVITSFSGNRATSSTGDFVIEESNISGFINVAGIESPGLTAAPAIAKYVVELVQKTGLKFEKNPQFNPNRRPYRRISEMDGDELTKLIKEEPAYGRVVCRCEVVSEGEILDALSRSIPINTTDAIKRRTRCGMGRCQAGFCTPKLLEVVARKLNIPRANIAKSTQGSALLMGRTKRSLEEKS